MKAGFAVVLYLEVGLGLNPEAPILPQCYL
jgi:hypothetical protein